MNRLSVVVVLGLVACQPEMPSENTEAPLVGTVVGGADAGRNWVVQLSFRSNQFDGHGCTGEDADHLCAVSHPGSGGGGSSLVPPGGAQVLSDVLEPSVTITVTQYG